MQGEEKIYRSGALGRLDKLLGARLQPGADKARIDERIWDLFGDTWAVMYTDLSGFSRLVAEYGIIHFLQTIHESERIFIPCIDAHDGILLKTEGDSLFVIFRQPLKAVQCAFALLEAADHYNRDCVEAEHILVGAGIGYGRMLVIGDHDVFGAEVNAACKLGEDMAKGGDIFVTDAVAESLQSHPSYTLRQLERCPAGTPAAYKVIRQG